MLYALCMHDGKLMHNIVLTGRLILSSSYRVEFSEEIYRIDNHSGLHQYPLKYSRKVYCKMEGPISIAALKDAIAAAHMKEPSKIVLEKCKTGSTLTIDRSY